MQCPTCRTDNRIERRFCHACGGKMVPVTCPSCAFVNFPGEVHCGGCGAEVGVAAEVRGTPPAPRKAAAAATRAGPSFAASDAERRQMTVMFVDLVGSTRLSNELDPEDLRDLITAFQGACAAQIARFDGFIARYMGDGMLVYFGYPRAHEDSAERAVRAGLAIIDAVGQLDAQLDERHGSRRDGRAVRASVRVGIASGRVVVGDIIGEGASEERAVVGETPNLAARLQSLAEPDTVVISDRTRRLVGSIFDVDDLGTHSLKGFEDPVQAWQATGEARRAELALEAESPLVGRAFELALLKERWRTTGRGEARIVTLVGEAGAGKSRLLVGFLEHAAGVGEQVKAIRYQCSRHHESTALYPVIELISRAVPLELSDTTEQRRTKVDAWARSWSSNPEQDIEAIYTLLGISENDHADKSPEERRDHLLTSLWRGFGARLGGEPMVLAFEDIQWADPSTLKFIGGLMQRSASASLMVVLTHRPEFDPPWGHRGGSTAMTIGKLGPEESRELVMNLAGDVAIPSATVDTILARSDGVAAYLTELTRTVLGALGSRDASSSATSIQVPETLQGSFAAQLDQLGDAREIAQLAATVGRTFSMDLLSRVWQGDPDRLDAGIKRIVAAGLVVPTGAEAGTGHAFRYALLRDVAYESLLKSRQRALHDRIVEVLLNELPDAAEADEVMVARHLTGAKRGREASQWWSRAAETAAGRAAVEESIAHLRCAVESLEPEVDLENVDDCRRLADLQIELALRLRLRQELDEGFEILAAAEALARRHDLAATLSHIHFSRGNLYFNLREPEKCEASHQLALEEARRAGSKLAEVRALGGLADATMARSDVAAAASLFYECVDLAEKHGFAKIAAANAGVAAFAGYWTLDHETARRYADIAYRRARETRHVRGLLNAINARVLLALDDLDFDLAGQGLEEIGAMTFTKPGFVEAFVAAGWMRFHRLRGDRDKGAAALRGALERVTPDQIASVIPKASLLSLDVASLEPGESVESIVSEVLEVLGDDRNQTVEWAAIELFDGLMHHRAWGQLRRVFDVVAGITKGSGSERARLWLEAAAAILGYVDAGGTDAARAEVDRVVAVATKRGVGSVRVVLEEALAGELIEAAPVADVGA